MLAFRGSASFVDAHIGFVHRICARLSVEASGRLRILLLVQFAKQCFRVSVVMKLDWYCAVRILEVEVRRETRPSCRHMSLLEGFAAMSTMWNMQYRFAHSSELKTTSITCKHFVGSFLIADLESSPEVSTGLVKPYCLAMLVLAVQFATTVFYVRSRSACSYYSLACTLLPICRMHCVHLL